jgi:toxin HigB-1
MINNVIISKKAQKDLLKIPYFIVNKLKAWVMDVELNGIHEVRKIPGYHDEPLKGKRRGQRSIRLSQAYRAIYVINKDESIEFVLIEEVNKHEY